MEDNDTIQPSENFTKDQTAQQAKQEAQAMSDQPGSMRYIQHYGQMLIDPFGLLRKVIATVTFPKIIEELSLYVMITLTALWDFIIVMVLATVVVKILTVGFYCVKKLSRCLCIISSGKNKRALRRLVWDKQQQNIALSSRKKLKNIPEIQRA